MSALHRPLKSTLLSGLRSRHTVHRLFSTGDWGYSPTNDGKLTPWVEHRGIQILNPGFTPQFTKDASSRVVMKSGAVAGEVLAIIPKHEVFCASNVFNTSPIASKLIGDALVGYSELETPGTIQANFYSKFRLALLAWMQQHAQLLGSLERINSPDTHEDVSWRSWIEFWPSHVVNSVYLGDDDVRNWLPISNSYSKENQSHFIAQINQESKFLEVLTAALEYDLQHLLDRVEARSLNKDELFSESITKLYSVVNSKSIDFTLSGDSHWEELGLGIVPLLDFVQHGGENDGVFSSNTGIALKGEGVDAVLEIVATRDVGIEQELHFDFGVRCNEAALGVLGLRNPSLPNGPISKYISKSVFIKG